MANSSRGVLVRATAAGAAVLLGGVFAQIAAAEPASVIAGPASVAAAKAKPKPAIRGRLSRPGYKVIAVSARNRATSVSAKGRRFSLHPPTASVTLHLRAPDGRYAGPIVVRRAGKRAVLGVRAGAQLGTVRIHTRYAKPIRRLAKKWIDPDLSARAKKGLPIGAGRIGLVRTKLPRHGGPGDRDLDGIPNGIDVDDDGDLILDGYDRPSKARTSAHLAQSAELSSFPDGTDLKLTTMFGWPTPYGAVNVNGGTTDEQLAAALRSSGMLGIEWGGIDPGSGEFDCGTLGYCTRGGTGLWRETNEPPDPTYPRVGRPPFPSCCDADGDGLGSLIPWQAGGEDGGQMFLLHGATVDEMHADDVLIARGTDDGAAVEYPSSVGFVFASVPVIAAYDDMQGGKGTFSYPPAPECLAVIAGRPGSSMTPECAPPVRVKASGDLVLQFKIWRPQRSRLQSEPGTAKWMDVGHLAYAIALPVGAGGGGYCPASSYEAVDPSLTPLDSNIQGAVPVGSAFADSAEDQPASAANTLSVTLNLTKCYASYGATSPGAPQVQIWTWALSNTYPHSAAPPDAHSQTVFTVVR